jgi:hypothetical protein
MFLISLDFNLIFFHTNKRKSESPVDLRCGKLSLNLFLEAPKLFLNVPINVIKATTLGIPHVHVHSLSICE